MAGSFLFYVSGHGYGHARRMTQVIRAMRALAPEADIHVRSAAPARIFEPLAPDCIEPCDIDAGLLEIDPLTIDRPRSIAHLQAFMARRASILADEVAAIGRLRPSLIVADIPFLAGDAAAKTGIPCIGISNFTWDWIYENLFVGDSRYAALAGGIAESYCRFGALLELPLVRTCPAIAEKVSMPLIAMQSHRDPAGILAQLGISPRDKRPRVLFGTRGGLSPATVGAIAADAPEFFFLIPGEPLELPPDNVICVRLDPELDFSDVLRVCDVVVSKLGYGIVSECIATQTRMVWPPREGFVEDAIVEKEVPPFVPMTTMLREDYYAGRWASYLRRAMELPVPARRMPVDGAEACAKWLLRHG